MRWLLRRVPSHGAVNWLGESCFDAEVRATGIPCGFVVGIARIHFRVEYLGSFLEVYGKVDLRIDVRLEECKNGKM